MRRQERRRKFNEAVINCLYPPRPSQVISVSVSPCVCWVVTAPYLIDGLLSQVEEEEDPKSVSSTELKVDCFPGLKIRTRCPIKNTWDEAHDLRALDVCADDSGDAGSPSLSESDGEAVGGERKMTRAQRKRIRKKKLREESIRRGKMVGPLLLSVDEDESAKIQKDETKNSQRNARVDYAYFDPQGSGFN